MYLQWKTARFETILVTFWAVSQNRFYCVPFARSVAQIKQVWKQVRVDQVSKFWCHMRSSESIVSLQVFWGPMFSHVGGAREGCFSGLSHWSNHARTPSRGDQRSSMYIIYSSSNHAFMPIFNYWETLPKQVHNITAQYFLTLLLYFTLWQ